MKKTKLLFLLAIQVLLLSGFKKNTHQIFFSEKPVKTISDVSLFSEQPEVSIADRTTIQGDKGKTTVEVLVYLSQASSEPVTLEFNTENGSAIAGADYIAESGSIMFKPGETFKWITINIIGKVAADPDEGAPLAADVTLQIKIQKVKNAIIKKASAIITIIKNILQTSSFNIGNKSMYEVVFSYGGYINVDGDVTNCPTIQRYGQVRLRGYLAGHENVGPNDPVIYTGELFLTINMDQCIAERLPNGEDAFCVLNVAFAGEVMTELKIDEADRGGYIKLHQGAKNPTYTKNTGGCITLNAAEKKLVPDNSIATIFNGRELPMLIDITSGHPLKKLGIGAYSQKDDAGNLTIVEVLRKVR